MNKHDKAIAETIRVNDVVQIVPEYKNAGWCGSFVLVEEIKQWGIQGFVHQVKSSNEFGRAYIRLNWGDFEVIGAAKFTLSD